MCGGNAQAEQSPFSAIDIKKARDPTGFFYGIGEVMDYAVATGRREQNPVTKMTHMTIAPHNRTNNPAISMDELPEFLHDLEEYRGFPITKLMMKFMLLTALRTGEARDLVCDWVDLENKLITIPPSGHKVG